MTGSELLHKTLRCPISLYGSAGSALGSGQKSTLHVRDCQGSGRGGSCWKPGACVTEMLHVSCSSQGSCLCHHCRQTTGLSIAGLPWALPPFPQPPAPGTGPPAHVSPACVVPRLLAGEVGVVAPGSSGLFSFPGILLLAHFYLPDEVSVCPRHHGRVPPLPTPGEPVPTGGGPSPRAAGISSRRELL